MSELKYFFSTDGEVGTMSAVNDFVCLKSEADKVIAELKDDCAYWKMSEGNAVNAMHETEEYAMQLYNELRHQKYKRCLAMAKMCKARYVVENVRVNSHCASWDYTESEEMKNWERWQKRWLELAKKFKEAK